MISYIQLTKTRTWNNIEYEYEYQKENSLKCSWQGINTFWWPANASPRDVPMFAFMYHWKSSKEVHCRIICTGKWLKAIWIAQ